MTDWLEDEPDALAAERRWPMAPTDLLPRERWLWWQQLWSDALMLAQRYRISPFDPRRDRAAFDRFLIDSGCQPPPDRPAPAGRAGAQPTGARRSASADQTRAPLVTTFTE